MSAAFVRGRVLPFLLVAVVACNTTASVGMDPQQVPKVVLAHYMPWFASKPVSGYWGWHWTMDRFDPEQGEAAAHDTPLIGLYDSGDPLALECHVLLMKLAGIGGVVIDWYGTGDFRDYAVLHRNSQALVEYVKKVGLRFAVCYEDQTVKHMVADGYIAAEDALAQGRHDLQWLEAHWFSDAAYVHLDGRPVLLVFGPQYFSGAQWASLLEPSRPRPLLYALPHLATTARADGVFGWPPVAGGQVVSVAAWQAYLDRLYAGDAVVGVAFPGFRDIYQEAGLHDSYGAIDYRDGATFAETFERAWQSEASLIQIATWNDHGEGTGIEPTRGAGYAYLEAVQRQLRPLAADGRALAAADLRLPVWLYELKKHYAGDAAVMAELEEAARYLYGGRCAEARAVLDRYKD